MKTSNLTRIFLLAFFVAGALMLAQSADALSLYFRNQVDPYGCYLEGYMHDGSSSAGDDWAALTTPVVPSWMDLHDGFLYRNFTSDCTLSGQVTYTIVMGGENYTEASPYPVKIRFWWGEETGSQCTGPNKFTDEYAFNLASGVSTYTFQANHTATWVAGTHIGIGIDITCNDSSSPYCNGAQSSGGNPAYARLYYSGTSITFPGNCPANNRPNPPTLTFPADGSGTTSNWITSNPTFTATVSDPDGGNVRAYFNFAQVAGNPVPPADQNGTTVPSGQIPGSTWTPSPVLVDGKYNWRAKAIDPQAAESGYTGYWRVKKDSLAPTASCSAPTLSGSTISISSLSGTDPVPASGGTPSGVKNGKLERRIDGGTWSTSTGGNFTGTVAASGQEYTASMSNSFNETVTTAGTYEYQYYVTDGAGRQSSTVNCGSIVVSPDFSISICDAGETPLCTADPAQHTIIAGGSTTYNVTVSSIGGFSGTVNIYASLYDNATDEQVDFNNNLVACIGELCKCNRTDVDRNGIVNNLDVLLLKPYLDKTCSTAYPNPNSLDRYYCNRTDIDRNGIVNNLDVLLLKPYLGQTCSQYLKNITLNPIVTSVTLSGGSASTPLTVSSSTSTPSGTLYVRTTGVYTAAELANGPERKGASLLTVSAPFNYSLSNSGSITVIRGNSQSNTITATLVSGATQPVSFSLSGNPAGTTYSFSPLNCSPTCNTQLTINTSSATPTGTFPITVTGSPLSKTTIFSLIVQPPPALSCSIDVPSSVPIGGKVTWTVIPSGGIGGPYTVNSWVGEGVDKPDSPSVDGCDESGPPEEIKDCQYFSDGSYTATATITDGAGITSCSGTVKISSLPIWKEIPPVGWIFLPKLVFHNTNGLDKLLASVVNFR